MIKRYEIRSLSGELLFEFNGYVKTFTPREDRRIARRIARRTGLKFRWRNGRPHWKRRKEG